MGASWEMRVRLKMRKKKENQANKKQGIPLMLAMTMCYAMPYIFNSALLLRLNKIINEINGDNKNIFFT